VHIEAGKRDKRGELARARDKRRRNLLAEGKEFAATHPHYDDQH